MAQCLVALEERRRTGRGAVRVATPIFRGFPSSVVPWCAVGRTRGTRGGRGGEKSQVGPPTSQVGLHWRMAPLPRQLKPPPKLVKD